MNASDMQITDGPGCPALPVANGLPSPETLASPAENPDARIQLIDHEGKLVAHAALWWKETPSHDGERLGTIGGFAANDAVSAKRLLDAAADRLAKAGCRLAVGPMNGNTWRSYRYVIEDTGRSPFLLEPRNPALYPEWWRQSGFGELSRYSSSVIQLDGQSTVPAHLKERLERSGLVIRKLNPENYDEELRAIHAVSLKSFSSNFLYTPLHQDAFLDAQPTQKQESGQ